MPDVDGFTSSALFINFFNDNLKKVYPNVEISYHMPQGKEHGLRTIVDELAEEQIADLLILPDSSSNDYNEHQRLHEMGYDILCIDHHEADHYSENAVVINNQLSQNYPNKALSGVGVVYKFLQYFEAAAQKDTELNYKPIVSVSHYLDIVALGMCSDMMSMQTPENRYIADKGFSSINNALFKEIIKKQCYSMFGISTEDWNDSYYTSGKVTQTKVVFYVTPLINALIRMGNPREKELLFESFINGDKKVHSTKRGASLNDEETIAEQSVRNCVNARNHQNKEKEKAIELLDIQISNECLDENKILILNADDLYVSNNLTGLIAMGIAAKYKKPTILGRISPDGYLKGSSRGREESELKDFKAFLKESGLTDYAEGHANAFGTSIKVKDIPKLYSYANEKLADVDFNENFYEADFIIQGNYSDIVNLVTEIDAAAQYWGQLNSEPLIVVENITIPKDQIQIIGSKKDTIKFTFNGITYILFRAADTIDQINCQSADTLTINCAGKANLNKWGGRITPQIYVDAIELKESSIYDF